MSRDVSINEGEGEAKPVEGDINPPNVPSLSVKEVALTSSDNQIIDLVKGEGHEKARESVDNERGGVLGQFPVMTHQPESEDNIMPKHAVPYLTIRQKLEKVKLMWLAIIHKIPSKSVPLVPDSYPKSSLVMCSDGKKALSFLVRVCNP